MATALSPWESPITLQTDLPAEDILDSGSETETESEEEEDFISRDDEVFVGPVSSEERRVNRRIGGGRRSTVIARLSLSMPEAEEEEEWNEPASPLPASDPEVSSHSQALVDTQAREMRIRESLWSSVPTVVDTLQAPTFSSDNSLSHLERRLTAMREARARLQQATAAHMDSASLQSRFAALTSSATSSCLHEKLQYLEEVRQQQVGLQTQMQVA